MSYEIIRNDITRVKADAIVNTANPRVRIGAGTDTAIHRAAGPELLAARKKIGNIAPGEVAVTPAFNLDAKFVIHAVGPAWRGGNDHEEELLRRTYDQALQAALDNGCKSVAFPLMGTGSYGFPGEKSMSIAISAFTDFLMAHDMHIILVVFRKSIFELAGHLFDDLRSYVDENYVANAHAAEYSLDGDEARYNERREVSFFQNYYRKSRRDWDTVCAEPAMAPKAVEPEPLQEVCSVELNSVEPDDVDLSELVNAAQMTFQQYLFKLIDEKGMTDPQVYGKAEIKKQQFSKIRSNRDYQPTKSLALRLAVALELDYDTTLDFLARAGYTLSKSNYTDIVIGYFIKNRNYDPICIDTALCGYHQPALFTLA